MFKIDDTEKIDDSLVFSDCVKLNSKAFNIFIIREVPTLEQDNHR